MRVVFLCKGTRGDISPFLALAQGFKRMNSTDSCTLATHSCHRLKFDNILKSHNIDFAAVDELGTDNGPRITEKLELQVCSGRGFSKNQQQERIREMHGSLRACRGADAIVFNLFACEGWFIAKYFDVPCVAASPFAVTRTPPVTFESKFVDAYPDLYQRLRNSPRGRVSYGDIDHWMWRLYLDDFGEFCDNIGLPVCPYAELRPDDPLPPSTTLLYGISPKVIEKPQYWPSSIILCSYWFLDVPSEPIDDVRVYHPTSGSSALTDFLAQVKEYNDRPVYIGFGSMEELGFFSSIDCVELLCILNEGLVQCGKKALLQLNPNSNLLKSWEMLCKNFQNCNIHCIMQYVPHSSLFPLCQSVVHHGGSGTVGMALMCGIPQVVCPFMFDQSYWGDKVSWMGVGESVGHPRSLKPEPFASALVNVSSDDIRSMAASYGKMLQKENGVEYAVQQLVKEFSTL
ncbi:uncharacterized protein [Acropora muricata]|uniref:uncharacterized protein n=1 Tax=Acropora muricata TaxID=159855 RepID=UPI0010FCD604